MPLEHGVHDIPIELAAALEPQRACLHSTLLAAQRRLTYFALKHGYQAHVQQPFARLFHVYADKLSFDHDLLELCGLDTTIELPSTYCAALEQGVLVSVSPELYRCLYPQGDEESAYEKLLTHEMAHRLHIRVLGGNEEAMGPVWFYEGFALYAAGQFERIASHLTAAEIWDVVNAEEGGDYRQYATLFRHFLEKAPLQQLIDMAGEVGLVDRLRLRS
jgi:hypothetical protein